MANLKFHNKAIVFCWKEVFIIYMTTLIRNINEHFFSFRPENYLIIMHCKRGH